MNPLELIKLTNLMEITQGRPEVVIGLIDGPVVTSHPALVSDNILEISGSLNSSCTQKNSIACRHGTFMAGMLNAKRGSPAPAICPDCTLMIRPIFSEAASDNVQMPSATPEELAAALIETVEAGVRVINLSAALVQPSARGEYELKEALDYSMRRAVIVVAAAGNQRVVGGTVITSHPWVIPVVACDLQGRPLDYSNLGASIGKRGLSAPGDGITSLGSDGDPLTLSGTSVAAPFVTGAIALLWSELPNATAGEVKLAVTQTYALRRNTIVPPLLDARAAYQVMATNHGRRRTG